ncbi:MAG: hypothetical protein KC933_20790 [Myxococcales bacterium]|nr:hypothetical protein [Myxococcales bacterium]MCB9650652.1 hypothetical protein [Deltaproteobacteria bacterium]
MTLGNGRASDRAGTAPRTTATRTTRQTDTAWDPNIGPTHRRKGPALALILLVGLAGCTTSTKVQRQERQARFEETRAAQERSGRRKTKRRDARPLIQTPELVRLDALARRLNADPRPLERPCANAICTRRVLDRVFKRLDRLDARRQGHIRILQLGDSHIAADYITRTIRDELQARFGNGGRGLVAIGQKSRYGGRALSRTGWERHRIVDEGQAGKPFGVTGMAIEAARGGAEATFSLVPEDDVVSIYYHAHPGGGAFRVFAEDEELLYVDTDADSAESRVATVPIPMHRMGDVVPPELLRIRTDSGHVRLMGISFESDEPGIILDAIGPVGADANVYLTFDQASMRAHMRELKPDLVVLMVGGNDGLAVRKAVRSLDEVRQQHVDLITAVKQHAPDAACLVWAPMDAGERLDDGLVISKRYIEEIRDLQRETALEMGCAFWDTYESMGGSGSFGRWLEEGIMNSDMVHPRAKGGDLMGHLFARAFMSAYLGR